MKLYYISNEEIKEDEVVGKFTPLDEWAHEKYVYQFKGGWHGIVEVGESLVFKVQSEAKKKLAIIQAEELMREEKARIDRVESALKECTDYFKNKPDIEVNFDKLNIAKKELDKIMAKQVQLRKERDQKLAEAKKVDEELFGD